MKKWKRLFSGILAAMTVISSCTTGMVMASSEETEVEVGYPTLEEIIDQLDEDEIVQPDDYEVTVGSDLDISLDFTNFNVPNWMKVNIYFDGAYNEKGEYFSTDHADKYKANYHVEPVSGHPVYQVSRNVRVKEAEKPNKSTSSNDGKAVVGTSPNSSSSSGEGDSKSDSSKDVGDGSSDDDSQNNAGGGDTFIPPRDDDSEMIWVDQSGGSPVPRATGSSGDKGSTIDADKSSKAGNLSDDSLAESSILDKIRSYFAPDDETAQEEAKEEAIETESAEEEIVGAGPRIDGTVDCISGSFGSVYVNHVYQTVGNSNGDVIVYCGEVDMHFGAGAHSRVNLVGSTLQGTVITEEEALRVGIMQHYFFYVSGVSTDQARGLTQRAVWALAVGDNSPSVNNPHWLEQAGLTSVYEAGKAYAAANASKYVLDEAYGSVEVLFEFSGLKLQGTVMVAFEKVSINGVEIMTHADINDEDQTLYVPKICTSAAEMDTAAKEMEASGEKILIDRVSYESLPEGRYVMQGTLMDKSTGKPLRGNDGKSVLSSAMFTSNGNAGSVDIKFSINADELSGTSLVVFERAFAADENGKAIGEAVASHEDINDADQTVVFPAVSTELLDDRTGSHTAYATNKVTHVDHVRYRGLIVGNEYTVKGTLVDKESGETILDHGQEVTAVLTFKAEKPEGMVDLVFEFDASALAGQSVVAFEYLYSEDRLIASHADLEDEDQTIHYPKIRTELKSKSTGSHIVLADATIVLVDTVTYENLIVGKTYNVDGVLMDKETGEEFKVNNESVRATTEFTPTEANGTVELEFKVNGLSIAGRPVVAFEVLFDGGKEVAIHADIHDEAQTVYIPSVSTELKNKESGGHSAEPANPRTFVDTVSYKGLMPGEKYTTSGVLMDKATNKMLVIGGKEAMAAKTFTADKERGTIELEFKIDCSALSGKGVVAFEYLYQDGELIAYHTDINDASQTVSIKKPTSTPTPTPKSGTPTPKNTTPTAARTANPSTSGGTTVSRSNPVKTGDTQNVILPTALLLGAVCVIGGIMLVKKKKGF
ncbi:MAG: VaFE repeat-containing surface-anchored protein [Lachnospiraceae bacterium]|nr:VaFE repeat-containing surface-anchored protein [Lachnospiraceae bacterium]